MIHLLGQTFSTYALLMAVSSLIFVCTFARLLTHNRPQSWLWLLDTWPLFAIAFLGARLGYILAHLDAFSEQPLQWLLPWTPGLSFHGGLLAALLALALLPLKVEDRGWRIEDGEWRMEDRKEPPSSFRNRLADALALALALAGVLAWLALLSIGDAWGRAVALRSAPGVVVLPDLYGLRAPRYPVQALGALYSLLTTIVLWLLYRSHYYRPGLLIATYCLLYLGGQFALDFLRADPAPVWQGLRVSQWLDLLGGAFALAWLAGSTFRRIRKTAAQGEQAEP